MNKSSHNGNLSGVEPQTTAATAKRPLSGDFSDLPGLKNESINGESADKKLRLDNHVEMNAIIGEEQQSISPLLAESPQSLCSQHNHISLSQLPPASYIQPSDALIVKIVKNTDEVDELCRRVRNCKAFSLYINFRPDVSKSTKKETKPEDPLLGESDTTHPKHPIYSLFISLANGDNTIYVVVNCDLLDLLRQDLLHHVQVGTRIASPNVTHTIMALMIDFSASREQISTIEWVEPTSALWLLDPFEHKLSETLSYKLFNHLANSDYEPVVNFMATYRDLIRRFVVKYPELEGPNREVCLLLGLLFPLMDMLSGILSERKMIKWYEEIEVPVRVAAANAQIIGIGWDLEHLNQIKTHLAEEIESSSKRICKMAGSSFKPGNYREVGKLIFERLKLQQKLPDPQELAKIPNLFNGPNTDAMGIAIPLTATGFYKTDDEVLQVLRQTHPVIEELLHWRKIRSFSSVCVGSISNVLVEAPFLPHCGYRIHPDVQLLSQSGKIEIKSPNLQSIFNGAISSGKYARVHYEIAKGFVSTPGFSLFSVGFPAIIIHFLAYFINDPILTGLIGDRETERDIFKSFAAHWLKMRETCVSVSEIEQVRHLIDGVLIHRSLSSLSDALKVPQERAELMQTEFLKSLPMIDKYLNEVLIAGARRSKNGQVETLFGRKVIIPHINDLSVAEEVKLTAERRLITSILYGSIADFFKILVSALDDALPHGRFIAQLDNELVYEVLDTKLHSFQRLVSHLIPMLIRDKLVSLERREELGVNLHIEYRHGKNWAEMIPIL